MPSFLFLTHDHVLYVSLQDVYEKWCSVLDAVPACDATLEEELQKQQQNDQLRMQFAEKANELGAFIEEKHTALADLSMQGMGTMEAC